jgi:hypothetical protein
MEEHIGHSQLFKSWSNPTPPKGDYSKIFALRREKLEIFLSSMQKSGSNPLGVGRGWALQNLEQGRYRGRKLTVSQFS